MNNKILITGGSGGIGFALVNKFIANGYHVFAVARNINKLQDLQNAENLTIIQADINNPTDQKKILDHFHQEKLSIINNAAYSGQPTDFKDISIEEIRLFFETNFFSPLFLLQQLLANNTIDRVLNISSGAAQMAQPYLFGYCTSKSAMHHAFDCLKMEYPKTKFANLRPGMVDTPLQDTWRKTGAELFSSDSIFLTAKQNNELISVDIVANFVSDIFTLPSHEFDSKYWNIYTDMNTLQNNSN